MLSLDQVNLLESKVEKAVELIRSLSAEKDNFKAVLAEKDSKIAELEKLILTFKDEQSKIEEGITNALDRLSAFEDSLLNNSSSVQTENLVQQMDSSSLQTQSSLSFPAQQMEKHEQTEEEIQNEKDLNDILGNTNQNSDIADSNIAQENIDDSDKQMDIF